MNRISFFVLLVLPSLVQAQKIELPPKVVGEPCKFVTITAIADGQVKWVFPDGLDVVPQKLIADSKTVVVIASKIGEYKIWAYTAKGDIPSDPAFCVLSIVGGNGPDPKPPPPEPTGLEKRLKDALAVDTGKERLSTLVAMWKQSSALTASNKIVTTDGLWAAIKAVEVDTVSPALTMTRATIWIEMSQTFPGNFVLTGQQRRDVQAKVDQIVSVLEKLQ